MNRGRVGSSTFEVPRSAVAKSFWRSGRYHTRPACNSFWRRLLGKPALVSCPRNKRYLVFRGEGTRAHPKKLLYNPRVISDNSSSIILTLVAGFLLSYESHLFGSFRPSCRSHRSTDAFSTTNRVRCAQFCRPGLIRLFGPIRFQSSTTWR
jgi:hypothetical protein